MKKLPFKVIFSLFTRWELLLRYIFKCLLQQLPEGGYRLDEGTLCSGVRRLHRRSEADDVEPGVLAQNDRALQSCMIHLDDTILAKQLLVLLQQEVQNLRIRIGIPSAIATSCFHLHARHIETALEHGHHKVFHILTTGACQDLNGSLTLTDIDDGEVAGGLYDTGIGRDKADNTIVTSVDGIDEVILDLYRHLLLGCLHLFYDDLDALWFDEFELVIERLFPVGGDFLQGSDILLRQRQHSLSLEGDGVTHITTIP